VVSGRLGWSAIAIIILCTPVVPVLGLSVSCSSVDGRGAVFSSEGLRLDASTSLRERLVLDSGSISQDRQASGTGTNSLTQSLSGTGYALSNDIESLGSFSVSTSAAALPQEASLSQDAAGSGSLSLAMSGTQGFREAGGDASVAFGELSSAQSLYVGQDAALSSLRAAMAGQEGYVGTGAFSDSNAMLAAGSFQGAGVLEAQLSSMATERAVAGGEASLDGLLWLNDDTFQAVSSPGTGMGMAAQRLVGEGIGTFDMNVLNLQAGAKDSAEQAAYQTAAQTAGGSSSSYLLTGYRLNSGSPVQIYLNPGNAPSGMTDASTRDAIAASANTWDDAVAANLFADTNTVIVDSSRVVDDPYSSTPKRDGYNVNAWWGLGSSYLGLCRWWTNGVTKDGYYSIIESDIWYSRDKSWTADWNVAVSQGKIDLQSVATHELGHSIGMGDIYSSTYGGVLDPSDPRTQDFNQVMNLYNGPQRLLGNGDLAGAQTLYGQPVSGPQYCMSAPFTTI
jgi:hypothetical protein